MCYVSVQKQLEYFLPLSRVISPKKYERVFERGLCLLVSYEPVIRRGLPFSPFSHFHSPVLEIAEVIGFGDLVDPLRTLGFIDLDTQFFDGFL